MGKGTHEKTPELQALVESGMSSLDQAIHLHGDTRNSEVRSALALALWIQEVYVSAEGKRGLSSRQHDVHPRHGSLRGKPDPSQKLHVQMCLLRCRFFPTCNKSAGVSSTALRVGRAFVTNGHLARPQSHGQCSRAFFAAQFVWGAKRWLAYGYHFFVGDKEKAETAYEACVDYDPARVDCVVFLSRLYLAGECAVVRCRVPPACSARR